MLPPPFNLCDCYDSIQTHHKERLMTLLTIISGFTPSGDKVALDLTDISTIEEQTFTDTQPRFPVTIGF